MSNLFIKFFSLAPFFLYSSVAIASLSAHAQGNAGPSMATLFRALNFLALIIGFYFLLKKPLKDFFENRATLLKKDIEETSKNYNVILKQSEELNKKIATLEGDSKAFMNSFKEEAELEKKKLIEQASELSKKMKQDAESLAGGELKKAKEELREVAVTLAAQLAEQKIRQSIGSVDRDRLNSKFIERLKSLN